MSSNYHLFDKTDPIQASIHLNIPEVRITKTGDNTVGNAGILFTAGAQPADALAYYSGIERNAAGSIVFHASDGTAPNTHTYTLSGGAADAKITVDSVDWLTGRMVSAAGTGAATANLTHVSVFTPVKYNYVRVGNMVTVYFSVTLTAAADAAAATVDFTFTELGTMRSSNFAATSDAFGQATVMDNANAAENWSIAAIVGAESVQFSSVSPSVAITTKLLTGWFQFLAN
jgi:hypothetical protein